LKETKRKRSKQQAANSRQPVSNQQSAVNSLKSVLAFRRFRPPLRALVEAVQGQPREISAWTKTEVYMGKL